MRKEGNLFICAKYFTAFFRHCFGNFISKDKQWDYKRLIRYFYEATKYNQSTFWKFLLIFWTILHCHFINQDFATIRNLMFNVLLRNVHTINEKTKRKELYWRFWFPTIILTIQTVWNKCRSQLPQHFRWVTAQSRGLRGA